LRPWIGNYDIILASSQTAVDFFKVIGSSVGFPIKCVVNCPILKTESIKNNLSTKNQDGFNQHSFEFNIKGFQL
jgi:hypothetical protein